MVTTYLSDEIQHMESGRFQEFCYRFFQIYFNNNKEFRMFGGTHWGVTRKGTPDILHVQQNGRQVAIQCSVMKNYWKITQCSISESKPIKDIFVCINKLKGLDKVILCSSTEIRNENQEAQIIKLVKKEYPELSIEIFCLDRFVREIERYSFKYRELIENFLPKTHAYYIYEKSCSENVKYDEGFYYNNGFVSLAKKGIAEWNPKITSQIYKPYKNVLSLKSVGSIDIQNEIIYDQSLLDTMKETLNKILGNSKFHRAKTNIDERIIVQIPFQQISSILMFQYIIDEYGRSISSLLTLDICNTSSIHILRDIEQGIDKSPDIVCLNLFNTVEFLSKNSEYVPVLILPNTSQRLVNSEIYSGAKKVYVMDKPYASLKFNYLDFVRLDLIKWDSKVIDFFPSKLPSHLRDKDRFDEQYLVWEPFTLLLLYKKLIKDEMVCSVSYAYPCIMLTKKKLSNTYFVNQIKEMLIETKKTLEKSDYLIANLLMKVKYFHILNSVAH